MDIQELEQLKMKTLQEVADGNVSISENKALLKKLEDEKEDFFKVREKQLEARLYTFFNDSRDLLEDTKSNYALVHEFYRTLKSFSTFLQEGYKEFQEMVDDYRVTADQVEREANKKIEEIASEKKILKLERESMEKEKGFIKEQRSQLENDKRAFRSQQTNLKQSLEALKKKK